MRPTVTWGDSEMGAQMLVQIKARRVAMTASSLLAFVVLCCPSAAGAAAFSFSTGNPDGKMAMASRPDSSGKPEIEAADDFVLSAQTAITHATFTGLLPTSGSVQAVDLEIYRVFPLDSNTSRTPRVPTRVNSPSDVDFQSRSSGSNDLKWSKSVLAGSFTAANSVLTGIHPAPGQTTGGDGKVTGQEVVFSVTLTNPFELPAGHYFFVPQVQVSGPTSSNFYWLSAPKPIVSPGTPFPAGSTDLQAWIRNSALEPDWLRVGTDIVGGVPAPTFNAAFSLNNAALPIGTSTQSLSSGVGVRLTVRVPASGRVRAFDPLVGRRGKNGHKKAWFTTLSVRATHGGIVRLTVVPNATGRAELSKNKTIHLQVEVTFTPTGGQPTAHTISITWHRK
jgi:hypothetical protein